MTGMTQRERIEHATDAIDAYLDSKGEPSEGAAEDYEISDLICDLLHLAQDTGFEPGLVLDRARMHFAAECEEEGIV